MSDFALPPDAEVKPIRWYRSPLPRETLRALTQRSDLRGLLQTVPFLLLLAVTATCAILAVGRLPALAVIAILFVHGTFYGFLVAGWHELAHGTVFKTRSLNLFFLRIFSFLGWHNDILYRQSHIRHHGSTLHPPEDLEVVLPVHLHVRAFLLSGIVDPVDLYKVLTGAIRHSLGRLKKGGVSSFGEHPSGEWENKLFPASDPKARARLFNWSRFTLLGHIAIGAVAVATGLWMLPVVTTFGRFYGGWLVWLCGNTQHTGLQDNVDDFRLCCRTIQLNPFLQFLYFHMNYHADHHMYAAVPCYNLSRLHQAIVSDMPHAPRGLVAAWREIIEILRRQQKDPAYQYVFELPAAGHQAAR
jgi:fatty acid desaturase